MNKKISILGIGKLGLCFALNAEKNGYKILGVDINENYINKLKNKKFSSDEFGVNNLLKSSNNIKFSHNIVDALKFSKNIFIFVDTPSKKNGEYDHSKIDRIIKQLKKFKLKSKLNLVIGCTVMPGYCEKLQKNLGQKYKVGYNPEFIAQGTIIKDQQYPDMVLIGSKYKDLSNMIKKINCDIAKNKPRVSIMSTTEAEIAKLSLNCFLTTKISFANMIGDLAIKSNCNPAKILQSIGSDSRIGSKYLNYGYGFGGPCFPRDNVALGKYAKKIGNYYDISKATDYCNIKHLKFQADQILKSNKNKKINFKYVTYKKESVSIEKSQKLALAVKIAKKTKVTIHERKKVLDIIKNKYKDLFKYKEIS